MIVQVNEAGRNDLSLAINFLPDVSHFKLSHGDDLLADDRQIADSSRLATPQMQRPTAQKNVCINRRLIANGVDDNEQNDKQREAILLNLFHEYALTQRSKGAMGWTAPLGATGPRIMYVRSEEHAGSPERPRLFLGILRLTKNPIWVNGNRT